MDYQNWIILNHATLCDNKVTLSTSGLREDDEYFKEKIKRNCF